jgi:hypothetical protein
MYPWAGQHLAEAIVEHRRRHAEPMRGNSALASAIRHWLRLRPEAVRAVEQLLSDARPRKDDLRRAVFLVEAL